MISLGAVTDMATVVPKQNAEKLGSFAVAVSQISEASAVMRHDIRLSSSGGPFFAGTSLLNSQGVEFAVVIGAITKPEKRKAVSRKKRRSMDGRAF